MKHSHQIDFLLAGNLGECMNVCMYVCMVNPEKQIRVDKVASYKWVICVHSAQMFFSPFSSLPSKFRGPPTKKIQDIYLHPPLLIKCVITPAISFKPYYFACFYPRPADSISLLVTQSVSQSVSQSVIIFEKSLNGHNSANFEATTSRFCMVIDLNETYMMMMMIMMMMMMTTMMMMKMKLIITLPILKLQPPDLHGNRYK